MGTTRRAELLATRHHCQHPRGDRCDQRAIDEASGRPPYVAAPIHVGHGYRPSATSHSNARASRHTERGARPRDARAGNLDDRPLGKRCLLYAPSFKCRPLSALVQAHLCHPMHSYGLHSSAHKRLDARASHEPVETVRGWQGSAKRSRFSTRPHFLWAGRKPVRYSRQPHLAGC
jgi:hypothetical protein